MSGQVVQAVEALYQQVLPHMRVTPTIYSEALSKRLGCHVHLKLEQLQYTHSFKIRGALAKASTLSKEELSRGLVCASGGNHGLGVCYAAKIFGTKARVYLSENVPQTKIDKIRAWGGEAVMHGASFDDAKAEAKRVAKEEKLVFMDGFDDDQVILGNGMLAHEIFQQVPQVDWIVASIGGGGLMGGVAAYAKARNPKTFCLGVQVSGADAVAQSLRAGRLVTLEKITSSAESLGMRIPVERTLKLIRKHVDRLVVVDDAQSNHAILDLLREEKLMVEMAASCCLAALYRTDPADLRGKHVVIVLCGSNYPVERLVGLIQAPEYAVSLRGFAPPLPPHTAENYLIPSAMPCAVGC